MHLGSNSLTLINALLLHVMPPQLLWVEFSTSLMMTHTHSLHITLFLSSLRNSLTLNNATLFTRKNCVLLFTHVSVFTLSLLCVTSLSSQITTPLNSCRTNAHSPLVSCNGLTFCLHMTSLLCTAQAFCM